MQKASHPNKNTKITSLHPLTSERWDDFEALFGKSGATDGCWCMWWRITRSQFENNHNQGNKQAMKGLVDSGVVPGILAYIGDQVVGWCSVAPRQDFGSLNRSYVLKPIDNQPVWSIVCFFVSKGYRGEGIAVELIRGAIDYVRQKGGRILEAYPTVTKDTQLPSNSSFMGIPALYAQIGFIECARPSASKMIMRYYLEE